MASLGELFYEVGVTVGKTKQLDDLKDKLDSIAKIEFKPNTNFTALEKVLTTINSIREGISTSASEIEHWKTAMSKMLPKDLDRKYDALFSNIDAMMKSFSDQKSADGLKRSLSETAQMAEATATEITNAIKAIKVANLGGVGDAIAMRLDNWKSIVDGGKREVEKMMAEMEKPNAASAMASGLSGTRLKDALENIRSITDAMRKYNETVNESTFKSIAPVTLPIIPVIKLDQIDTSEIKERLGRLTVNLSELTLSQDGAESFAKALASSLRTYPFELENVEIKGVKSSVDALRAIAQETEESLKRSLNMLMDSGVDTFKKMAGASLMNSEFVGSQVEFSAMVKSIQEAIQNAVYTLDKLDPASQLPTRLQETIAGMEFALNNVTLGGGVKAALESQMGGMQIASSPFGGNTPSSNTDIEEKKNKLEELTRTLADLKREEESMSAASEQVKLPYLTEDQLAILQKAEQILSRLQGEGNGALFDEKKDIPVLRKVLKAMQQIDAEFDKLGDKTSYLMDSNVFVDNVPYFRIEELKKYLDKVKEYQDKIKGALMSGDEGRANMFHSNLIDGWMDTRWSGGDALNALRGFVEHARRVKEYVDAIKNEDIRVAGNDSNFLPKNYDKEKHEQLTASIKETEEAIRRLKEEIERPVANGDAFKGVSSSLEKLESQLSAIVASIEKVNAALEQASMYGFFGEPNGERLAKAVSYIEVIANLTSGIVSHIKELDGSAGTDNIAGNIANIREQLSQISALVQEVKKPDGIIASAQDENAEIERMQKLRELLDFINKTSLKDIKPDHFKDRSWMDGLSENTSTKPQLTIGISNAIREVYDLLSALRQMDNALKHIGELMPQGKGEIFNEHREGISSALVALNEYYSKLETIQKKLDGDIPSHMQQTMADARKAIGSLPMQISEGEGTTSLFTSFLALAERDGFSAVASAEKSKTTLNDIVAAINAVKEAIGGIDLGKAFKAENLNGIIEKLDEVKAAIGGIDLGRAFNAESLSGALKAIDDIKNGIGGLEAALGGIKNLFETNSPIQAMLEGPVQAIQRLQSNLSDARFDLETGRGSEYNDYRQEISKWTADIKTAEEELVKTKESIKTSLQEIDGAFMFVGNGSFNSKALNEHIEKLGQLSVSEADKDITTALKQMDSRLTSEYEKLDEMWNKYDSLKFAEGSPEARMLERIKNDIEAKMQQLEEVQTYIQEHRDNIGSSRGAERTEAIAEARTYLEEELTAYETAVREATELVEIDKKHGATIAETSEQMQTYVATIEDGREEVESMKKRLPELKSLWQDAVREVKKYTEQLEKAYDGNIFQQIYTMLGNVQLAIKTINLEKVFDSPKLKPFEEDLKNIAAALSGISEQASRIGGGFGLMRGIDSIMKSVGTIAAKDFAISAPNVTVSAPVTPVFGKEQIEAFENALGGVREFLASIETQMKDLGSIRFIPQEMWQLNELLSAIIEKIDGVATAFRGIKMPEVNIPDIESVNTAITKLTTSIETLVTEFSSVGTSIRNAFEGDGVLSMQQQLDALVSAIQNAGQAFAEAGGNITFVSGTAGVDQLTEALSKMSEMVSRIDKQLEDLDKKRSKRKKKADTPQETSNIESALVKAASREVGTLDAQIFQGFFNAMKNNAESLGGAFKSVFGSISSVFESLFNERDGQKFLYTMNLVMDKMVDLRQKSNLGLFNGDELETAKTKLENIWQTMSQILEKATLFKTTHPMYEFLSNPMQFKDKMREVDALVNSQKNINAADAKRRAISENASREEIAALQKLVDLTKDLESARQKYAMLFTKATGDVVVNVDTSTAQLQIDILIEKVRQFANLAPSEIASKISDFVSDIKSGMRDAANMFYHSSNEALSQSKIKYTASVDAARLDAEEKKADDAFARAKEKQSQAEDLIRRASAIADARAAFTSGRSISDIAESVASSAMRGDISRKEKFGTIEDIVPLKLELSEVDQLISDIRENISRSSNFKLIQDIADEIRDLEARIAAVRDGIRQLQQMETSNENVQKIVSSQTALGQLEARREALLSQAESLDIYKDQDRLEKALATRLELTEKIKAAEQNNDIMEQKISRTNELLDTLRQLEREYDALKLRNLAIDQATGNPTAAANDLMQKMLQTKEELHRTNSTLEEDEKRHSSAIAQENRELIQWELTRREMSQKFANFLQQQAATEEKNLQKLVDLTKDLAEKRRIYESVKDKRKSQGKETSEVEKLIKQYERLRKIISLISGDMSNKIYSHDQAELVQWALNRWGNASKKYSADWQVASNKDASAISNSWYKATRANRDFDGQTVQTLKSIASLDQQMSMFAMTAQNAFSIFALQQFAKELIHIGGELEKHEIAMASILGSADKAEALYSDISRLSMVSPFTVQDLTKNVKQLAAFGIEYDSLYETTKRLSDIAAGVGVDFGRISYEYSQMMAMGYLDRRHLRMFSMSGVPLLQRLQEYYSTQRGEAVSREDVDKMIFKRQIGADVVKDILWDMTNEGGKFFNMQEIMAESLASKYANLENAWNLMLGDMAKSAPGDILKDWATFATELTTRWRDVVNTIGIAIGAFGAYKGVQKLASFHTGMYAKQITKLALTEEAHELEMLKTKAMTKSLTSEEIKRMAVLTGLDETKLRSIGISEGMIAAKAKNLVIDREINAENIRHILTGDALTKSQKLRTIVMANLNKAEMQLLLTEGGLTAKQAKFVAAWAASNRILGRFALTLTTIGKWFMSNIWTIAIVSFTAIAAAIYNAHRSATKLDRDLKEMAENNEAEISKLTTKFELLAAKIKECSENEEERAKIIEQMKSQFGEYISDLDMEALKYGKIEDAVKNVTAAIRDKQKAALVDEQTSAVIDSYKPKIGKERKNVQRLVSDELRKLGVDKNLAEEITSMIEAGIVDGLSDDEIENRIRSLINNANFSIKNLSSEATAEGVSFTSGLKDLRELYESRQSRIEAIENGYGGSPYAKRIQEIESFFNAAIKAEQDGNKRHAIELKKNQALTKLFSDNFNYEVNDGRGNILKFKGVGLIPEQQRKYQQEIERLTNNAKEAFVVASEDVFGKHNITDAYGKAIERSFAYFKVINGKRVDFTASANELLRRQEEDVKKYYERLAEVREANKKDLEQYKSVANPSDTTLKTIARMELQNELIDKYAQRVGITDWSKWSKSNGSSNTYKREKSPLEGINKRFQALQDVRRELERWTKRFQEGYEEDGVMRIAESIDDARRMALEYIKGSKILEPFAGTIGDFDDLKGYKEQIEKLYGDVEKISVKDEYKDEKSRLLEQLLKLLNLDIPYDMADATAGELAKMVNREMEDAGKKWDFFKTLVEAGMEPDVASVVADVSGEFVSFADELTDRLVHLLKGKGISVSDLLLKDDDEILNTYGPEISEYAKKLRTLVDSERQNVQKTMADAIKDDAGRDGELRSNKWMRDMVLAAVEQMDGDEALKKRFRDAVNRMFDIKDTDINIAHLFEDTGYKLYGEVRKQFEANRKMLEDIEDNGEFVYETDSNGNRTLKNILLNGNVLAADQYNKIRQQVDQLGNATDKASESFKNLWKWINGGEKNGQKIKFADVADGLKENIDHVSKLLGSVSGLFGSDTFAGSDIASAGKIFEGVSTLSEAMKAFSGKDYVTGIEKAVDSLSQISSALNEMKPRRDAQQDIIDQLELLRTSTEKALSNMTELMKRGTISDAKKLYEQQISLAEKNDRETINAIAGLASGYRDSWFRGWGSDNNYHSINSYIDKMLGAGDWDLISSVLGSAVGGSSDLWNLSSREWYNIITFASSSWQKIQSAITKDSSNPASGALIDQIEEYANAWMENSDRMAAYMEYVTKTSFDDIFEAFRGLIANLSAESSDFADEFENIIFNAIVNQRMLDMLGTKDDEDSPLGSWYAKLAKFASDEDGLTKKEVEELRKDWAIIQGVAEEIREDAVDISGKSDKESSSMSASIEGIKEEQADILAAYMASIRADVSEEVQILDHIDLGVSAIADALGVSVGSLPQLAGRRDDDSSTDVDMTEVSMSLSQMAYIEMPKLNVTAEAQLAQLDMIAAHTLAIRDNTAVIAEYMEVMSTDIHRASTGVQPLSVR